MLKARGYACNPHHHHACSSGHLTRSTPGRGQDDVVKGKVRFVVSLCWDNCGCLADNLPSTPHHWTLRQSILSVILYYYDKRIRGREKNYPIKKDYYVHYMFSTPSYYHEWQWVILACWLHNIPANCPVLTCDIAWDLPINIKRNQPKWSYKTLVVDILNFYHKTCQSSSDRSLVISHIIHIVANIENTNIKISTYSFQVKEARNFDAFKPQPQPFPPFQCQMFTFHGWVEYCYS